MKWLNIDRPLSSGCPYAPMEKRIYGALIGALGGIASSAIGSAMQSGFTKEQQKLQSRLNREEMTHSSSLQREQQDYLMNTMYGKSLSGMKNAGLNPVTANGTTPSVPSSGTPSTGGVGPAAHGEGFGSAGAAGLMAGKEVEMMDSQKKLIDAQADKLRADTNKTNQNILIDEWKTDPSVQAQFKNGLDASVMKTYSEADVNKVTMTNVVAKTSEIWANIDLMQTKKQEVQANMARTFVECQSLLKGMEEADSRMAVNYAHAELAKEQKVTEKAKQFDLYASGEHHKAGAAYDRAGIVERHQNARESKARQAGHEIATKMKEFRQKVVEASGSVTEQGSIMGANRILDLITPDLFKFGSNISSEY